MALAAVVAEQSAEPEDLDDTVYPADIDHTPASAQAGSCPRVRPVSGAVKTSGRAARVSVPSFPIADALRLIRTRQGLTQTAASKRDGAPDFRTLSHWETRRKLPSLALLYRYLGALGLDFSDLQEALDLVGKKTPKRIRSGLEGIERRLGELEGRVQQLGGAGQPAEAET